MLFRVHDPERGASALEYSAVIVLAAAMFVAVAMAGIADRPASMMMDALDQIVGNTPGETNSNSRGDEGADADDGSGGSGEDEASGSGGSGGDGDDGDDGCGWNLFCHGGNAVDAIGDGASAAWDWTANTAAPQVGGFFVGLGQGFWNDLTGIGDIFTTNPIDTLTGMYEGIKEDPWSLLISQEAREAWSNGDYGEAIGGGLWDVGSWFIPGVGWAAKGGKLGKLGRLGDDNNGNNNGNNNNDNNNEDNNNNNDNDNEEPDPERNRVSCPTNSFVAGTEVMAADGSTVPIESVEVGDRVWAFDPATGEEGPREVTHLIDGAGEKTLVDITMTGPADGTDVVTATDEHPFWVPETGEWVDAIDLDPGTELRTSAGTWARVTATDTRPVADQEVYNLTVADLDTYYVFAGETSVLVHNDQCFNTSAGEAADFLKPTQNTRNYEQQAPLEELSNDELIRAIENPADGDEILVLDDGRQLGGHHRIDELRNRVEDGRIDPDTPITLQWYD